MIGSVSGRWLAAGALALYALVAGVVLPLHEVLEAPGPRSAPVAGVSVDADCRDRDCHESSHRHRADVHDPATCVSCAQARAAASPAPAVAFGETVLPRIGGAAPASAAAPSVPGPASPPARAPPALS